MTEKVLRWWLRILTAAVTVLSIETAIRFGSMSRFLETHGLAVLNQDGKPVVLIGATPEGNGLISLYDRAGILRAVVSVTPTGDVGIALGDGSGNQRVTISVKPNGQVHSSLP
jgi:hypothetical protein